MKRLMRAVRRVLRTVLCRDVPCLCPGLRCVPRRSVELGGGWRLREVGPGACAPVPARGEPSGPEPGVPFAVVTYPAWITVLEGPRGHAWPTPHRLEPWQRVRCPEAN
jgi:hypothetical protein